METTNKVDIDSWLARLRHYLFVEEPCEKDDPKKAATEIFDNFLNRADGWSDFPFDIGDDLPDKDLTINTLELCNCDNGWNPISITDYIREKEWDTRCTRCRLHVDKFWKGNEIFERELAKVVFEKRRNNADMAKYSLIPACSDHKLLYVDESILDRVSQYIDELADKHVTQV